MLVRGKRRAESWASLESEAGYSVKRQGSNDARPAMQGLMVDARNTAAQYNSGSPQQGYQRVTPSYSSVDVDMGTDNDVVGTTHSTMRSSNHSTMLSTLQVPTNTTVATAATTTTTTTTTTTAANTAMPMAYTPPAMQQPCNYVRTNHPIHGTASPLSAVSSFTTATTSSSGIVGGSVAAGSSGSWSGVGGPSTQASTQQHSSMSDSAMTAANDSMAPAAIARDLWQGRRLCVPPNQRSGGGRVAGGGNNPYDPEVGSPSAYNVYY